MTTSRSHHSSTGQTSRKLDLWAGVAVVLGSILGTGIFMAPSAIASFSPSWWVALLFWIVGGCICAIGASIYGRLGLMYPQGGGPYIYLRESLGSEYSRFYSWASCLVICPAMLAATSLFFAHQWPHSVLNLPGGSKILALGVLAVVTFLNTRGIQLVGRLQKVFVTIQLCLFLGVLLLSYFLLPGGALTSSLAPPMAAGAGLSFAKGIEALAVMLWSFEGFNAATFITSEIEGGEKNVRRIGLIACGIVVILYFGFNFVALQNIPAAALIESANAAATLMGEVAGSHGRSIVFALTIVGIVTGLQTAVTIGPRITRAAAQDLVLPKIFARLEPKYEVPTHALWLQFAIASAYILLGHFFVLITCFIVMNWLFYGLTVVGFLKLRAAENNRCLQASLPRPPYWRADLVCGALFIAVAALLVFSQILDHPAYACGGLVAFALGLGGTSLYLHRRRQARGLADPKRARALASSSS